MGYGLDFSKGGRGAGRKARRRRLAACGLLAAVLLLLWPRRGAVRGWAAALPGRVDAALAARFAPGYAERLDELLAENFTLRQQLAAAAPLQTENETLRALLGSGAAAGHSWQPARVTARSGRGMTLAGAGVAGAAVVDPKGRLVGAVRAAEGGTLAVDFAGTGAGALPCLAGETHGVLARAGDTLLLTGLPRHSALPAGTLVTTADGLWVGMTEAPPTPDDTGLTEWAALTRTGESGGESFLVGETG